jgi:hypothetical protein
MAQTFEEWSEKFARENDRYPTNRESWDAATYAANVRAGDAGNEAERKARLEAGVKAYQAILKRDDSITLDELRDIFEKVQG